ncbi:MAG: prepilin-type N-terminal cleavage/methylation domain-containing protein [Candidatus Berkelbacteria bacterium]|nr:prepilin-type N-terminal cleavage/methylation domain-containing protein [Candidatus Berkelbacteria bacterium]
MKTKAFTLIEILVASFIFMMVIVMATASFAMIKKSNELTTDISKTNECAKQTENYINLMVRSANFGTSRIVAIDFADPKYSFINIDKNISQSVGFATFEKSDNTTLDNGKYMVWVNMVFKKKDATGQYGYFSLRKEMYLAKDIEGTIDDTYLVGGVAATILTDAINDPANPPQKIHSNDCAAIDPAKTPPSDAYKNVTKFFTIRGNGSYGGGPSGQIGTQIYSVALKDLFYNSLATQDQNKAMTRVFVSAVNNLRPI